MGRATLLSRIGRPELAQPQYATSDRELRDSILTNLLHMCGTRLGTMLTCPDYGIADVSEMVHAFPEAVTMMSQTLRHTIMTYEPRLQGIQIIHIPNEGADLTLRFEIRAVVATEGKKRAVQFETVLDASRRFTIR
jgi:type VI secretion system protein